MVERMVRAAAAPQYTEAFGDVAEDCGSTGLGIVAAVPDWSGSVDRVRTKLSTPLWRGRECGLGISDARRLYACHQSKFCTIRRQSGVAAQRDCTRDHPHKTPAPLLQNPRRAPVRSAPTQTLFVGAVWR